MRRDGKARKWKKASKKKKSKKYYKIEQKVGKWRDKGECGLPRAHMGPVHWRLGN